MLILLPPSEGKESPVSGGPLALPQLSFPTLTDTRMAVTDALVRLCEGPAARARTTLGISIRQDGELERNRRLLSAPTAPAGEIYRGVLYDALDLGSLGTRAHGRAAKDLAIASALFGLVRVNDHIPAYRLSADTVLPGVGRLSAAWRDVVSVALVAAAGRGIVIDMRSSAYVSLGPVPAALADRTAVIRVLQDRGGRRVVVSHHNKATKGYLTRTLLHEPRATSVDGLVRILSGAGYPVETAAPRRAGDPWTLDVIVDEV